MFQEVDTSAAANAVWAAAPAVLSKYNEQSTYALPFAPVAYIWLHLLDRYARAWRALEVLVRQRCLPLAKYGVRVLDVGTGPGPTAFAVHDFYQALVKFSEAEGITALNQPPEVHCVEYDHNTNHLRHNLAELVRIAAGEPSQDAVLSLCGALPDFRSIYPSRERPATFRALHNEEESYYDEIAGGMEWVPRYTAQEAHQIAQSLYRYRLFIFSNFLTTGGTVETFEGNLSDLLSDAGAGSIMLVLGGMGGEYPTIYDYMDRLAGTAGFERRIENQIVSSAETVLSDLVYEEGRRFYEHLQSLSWNEDAALAVIHRHFGADRTASPKTCVRAYRKNGRQRSAGRLTKRCT